MSRRAALGLWAVAGAAALTGCSLNNPFDEEQTPAAEAVPDLAPDVAVAVEAATLLRGAQAAVAGTVERHPVLAPRLDGLRATHAAHLAAVVDAVPDQVDTSSPDATYDVPARRATALTRLVATERTLHDELTALALRAESGPFARLLGAMAAATSQQLHEVAR